MSVADKPAKTCDHEQSGAALRAQRYSYLATRANVKSGSTVNAIIDLEAESDRGSVAGSQPGVADITMTVSRSTSVVAENVADGSSIRLNTGDSNSAVKARLDTIDIDAMPPRANASPSPLLDLPTRATTQNSTLLKLPNEILTLILNHLDTSPPSTRNRLERPDTKTFTTSGHQPLKQISLTNRRLRSVTLSHLFRHTRLDPYDLTNFIAFIETNSLARSITSLTATLQGPCTHIHPAWWARILNEIPLLARLTIIAAPHVFSELIGTNIDDSHAWAFNMPAQVMTLTREVGGNVRGIQTKTTNMVSSSHLNGNDRSPTTTTTTPIPTTAAAALTTASTTTTIAATALTTASMTTITTAAAAMLPTSIPPTTMNTTSTTLDEYVDYNSLPNLLTSKRWTHLKYNEGSSLLAYSTYEYFLKKTPSVLTSLYTSRFAPLAHLQMNLLSFEFVAIFPFYNHVDEILKCVREMKKLQKLMIKLCPEPESSVLTDEIEAAGGHLDVNDPWNEFDTAYHLIAHTVRYMYVDASLETFQVDDYKMAGVRDSLIGTLLSKLDGLPGFVFQGEGIWQRVTAT